MDNLGNSIQSGCSFTLLLCQFSINSGNQNNNIPKNNERTNFNTFRKLSSSQKLSLRNIKSPNHHTHSIASQNKQQYISDLQSLSSGTQSFTELSSVIGPRQTKKKDERSSRNMLRRKTSLSRLSPQLMPYLLQKSGVNKTKENPQISKIELNSNLQGENANNVFIDEITLNFPSVYHDQKDKQIQNGRPSQICMQTLQVINRAQRRVVTEQNKQNVQFQTKRPPALVCNSELLNRSRGFRKHLTETPQYNRQFNTKTSVIIHQRQLTQPKISMNNCQQYMRSSFPTNPTERGSIIINKMGSKIQNSNQNYNNSNFPQMKCNQIQQAPLSLILKQNQYNHHMRKVSSPRFPKRFNTLIDLNCKNVDSSGGDKTSSNHISILASQDSINRSNFENRCASFTKTIKQMTLKSMPLKQNF